MNDAAINITDQDVLRFTKLCAEKGHVMNHDQARERLYALVRCIELIYRPITQEDVNEYLKQDEKHVPTTI